MKKSLFIACMLFGVSAFSQVTILKIEGGPTGTVYMKGIGSPTTETANITATLALMHLTLTFGYEYEDENGDKYRYVNTAGGQWRKTTHTAAP